MGVEDVTDTSRANGVTDCTAISAIICDATESRMNGASLAL